MPHSGVRLEPTFQKQTRPGMRSGLAHQAPDVAGGRPLVLSRRCSRFRVRAPVPSVWTAWLHPREAGSVQNRRGTSSGNKARQTPREPGFSQGEVMAVRSPGGGGCRQGRRAQSLAGGACGSQSP